MTMTSNTLKATFLLCTTSLLTACLGGGSGESSDSDGESSGGDNDTQTISNSCFDLKTSQKEMVQLINEARSQSRSCGAEGNFPATGAISWNEKLFSAANAHSQDMVKENFFSHTGSDGLKFSDRMKSAGYSYSSAGENIAAGQSTTAAVVNAWLKSDDHCKNIMTSTYTEIGSACVSSDTADYKKYWTLLLAKPK